NTGRKYKIPPRIKFRIAATTTAISRLVSKSAVRLLPRPRTPMTALIVFLACDFSRGPETNIRPIAGPLILRRTGRVRDRAWRGRGSRSRSRSNRLRRRFRLRRPEQVPDHHRVRSDDDAPNP